MCGVRCRRGGGDVRGSHDRRADIIWCRGACRPARHPWRRQARRGVPSLARRHTRRGASSRRVAVAGEHQPDVVARRARSLSSEQPRWTAVAVAAACDRDRCAAAALHRHTRNAWRGRARAHSAQDEQAEPRSRGRWSRVRHRHRVRSRRALFPPRARLRHTLRCVALLSLRHQRCGSAHCALWCTSRAGGHGLACLWLAFRGVVATRGCSVAAAPLLDTSARPCQHLCTH
jgi:hypothetical protein